MITVSQIRDRLIDLLASEHQQDALASFEDWLAISSWNMHLDSAIQAQRLVGDIQLYLAEMDAENRDFDWISTKLRPFLSSFSVEETSDQTVISTSSSASFMRQLWAFSPLDMSPSMACGSQVHH